MKDKITKLRNELKLLKKSKKIIYKKKSPIKSIKLPYIEKVKKSYFEEDLNNNILEKL